MRPRPMTAENPRRSGRPWFAPSSFNEAAADDRGKPSSTWTAAAGQRRFNEAAADDRGKPPRPPPPAAGELASMRPRPMTAENRQRLAVRAEHRRASMRPRPMTAENMPAAIANQRLPVRFNEAAADDRGKLWLARRSSCPASGFNEAAADDRGKPWGAPPPPPSSCLLQ